MTKLIKLLLVTLLLALPLAASAQDDAEIVSLPERYIIFDAASVSIEPTDTGHSMTIDGLRNTYALWTLLQTSLRYDAPVFVNAWTRVEQTVTGSIQSTEDVIELTIDSIEFNSLDDQVILYSTDATSTINASSKLPASMNDISLTIALDVPFLNAIASAFENVRAEGPGVAFVGCATITDADECNTTPECAYNVATFAGVTVGSCEAAP